MARLTNLSVFSETPTDVIGDVIKALVDNGRSTMAKEFAFQVINNGLRDVIGIAEKFVDITICATPENITANNKPNPPTTAPTPGTVAPRGPVRMPQLPGNLHGGLSNEELHALVYGRRNHKASNTSR